MNLLFRARGIEMMRIAGITVCLSVMVASHTSAQVRSRVTRPQAQPLISPNATSPDCAGQSFQTVCREGGSDLYGALSADEVSNLVRAPFAVLDDPRMTAAVVDRTGRVLALLRNPQADPANDAVAIGLARTAAFFSHDMAPLSSRTVRFISGVHFPPGVKRAPPAALYGIENTNRGCDFNVTFNPGKCIPRATAINGMPCNASDQSGCGTGPVTGKPDAFDLHADPREHPDPVGLQSVINPNGLPVNPGGIPVFRVASSVIEGSFDDGTGRFIVQGPSHLVGGIGVAGVPPDHAEFAAFAAAALGSPGLFPAPEFPLPPPGRVFIDGIRLPFVEQGIRPEGTRGGTLPTNFIVQPRAGRCAPNRYLVGPTGSDTLSQAEVDSIVRKSFAAAQSVRGNIRLPLGSYARMVIAVSDLQGNILALYRMPDATIFSIDVAVAKARNVVFFSGGSTEASRDLPGLPPGTAVTNRTLGFGGQPLFPAGLDFTDRGPFFDLFLRDLANVCSQGSQPTNFNQNGIVFFPGSLPLYRNGQLVGGLGISGDGVEQDDFVSRIGGGDFAPPAEIRADQILLDNTRLPFLKDPRAPQVVTEGTLDPFDEP